MMTPAQKDTTRAIDAAKVIFDGRDPSVDCSSVLVTTEQAIATVLLTLFPDARKASQMLNEGLVPGIEQRLALYNSQRNPPHE